MKRELAKGHLDLLLLSALRDSSLHGYAIIERIRERSEGDFDLPEGSVYPALHRLEREGFLRSSWSKDAGRPRRVYRLSRRGRVELARQHKEWRSFARAVETVTGVTA